jgi:two-component system, LytTR family, response regulator
MKIRALIVDDEPWARRRIAKLLGAEQDVEIIGQCSDGAAAIQQVVELRPDLVFLDVQMPEVDGFEVVDAVGANRMPLVIFATAYDKYALRAFDANALDYLLKPFDEERFRKALDRARKELLKGRVGAEDALSSLLRSLRASGRYLQRLVVKSGGRVTFLKALEIDWIESSNNYLTLHVGRDAHVLRSTMNALTPKLDPEQFARIHRCTIVNLDRVKELQPWFRGEQVLVLKDDTRLTVGRAFRIQLQKYLQNSVR